MKISKAVVSIKTVVVVILIFRNIQVLTKSNMPNLNNTINKIISHSTIIIKIGKVLIKQTPIQMNFPFLNLKSLLCNLRSLFYKIRLNKQYQIINITRIITSRCFSIKLINKTLTNNSSSSSKSMTTLILLVNRIIKISNKLIFLVPRVIIIIIIKIREKTIRTIITINKIRNYKMIKFLIAKLLM